MIFWRREKAEYERNIVSKNNCPDTNDTNLISKWLDRGWSGEFFVCNLLVTFFIALDYGVKNFVSLFILSFIGIVLQEIPVSIKFLDCVSVSSNFVQRFGKSEVTLLQYAL